MLASNSFGQSGGHTVNAQSAERVLINGSNFTLRWNKIKLGQMSFLTRGNTGDIWEIWGKTLGPLRLVKNYYGVATQFFLEGEDLYRLAGNNSGFRENREVNFRSDRLPSIRSFNEKETTRGLTPQNPWGLSSVSPLRLFRRISKSVNTNFLCSGTHIVYDGKRKYEVMLEGGQLGENSQRFLDLSGSSLSNYWRCTAFIKGDSIIEAGKKLSVDDSRSKSLNSSGEKSKEKLPSGWSRAWLFGSDDRNIDFVFAEGCGPLDLAGFILSPPFGPIIGRADGACSTDSRYYSNPGS